MTDTRLPAIQPNAPYPHSGFEESNTIIVNFEEKLETLTVFAKKKILPSQNLGKKKV